MVGRTSRLAEKSPELFMLFSREIARWELREDDAPTPAATWAVVELVRTPKAAFHRRLFALSVRSETSSPPEPVHRLRVYLLDSSLVD